MSNIKLYKICLILSFVFISAGAIFKVMHWSGADAILILGYIASLVFVILGLIRVFGNKSKPVFEKILWLIGFIIFSWITGVLFYFMELRHGEKF